LRPLFSTHEVLVSDPNDQAKRRAGEAAVDRFVRDGACIGLGTGTTAYWAIRRVGERVAAGERIAAVATSVETERLCGEFGIPLVGLMERDMEVAIDGADEVAPDFALTKGGGGALFREKTVALATQKFVVIVDAGKLVARLGKFPTPVEIVPAALPWVQREFARAFPQATATVRERNGTIFHTDNANLILDCRFGEIDDPPALDAALRAIHGVVVTGIFVGLADVVLVADTGAVRELTPVPATSMG
jgi:ribose 5-phosphate isomerase A